MGRDDMSYMKGFDLTGRCAIVTGGGSGIGRGCALMLAQAGASVLVAGRRMGKLEEVQREIMENNGVCQCFSADLTNETVVEAELTAALPDLVRRAAVVQTVSDELWEQAKRLLRDHHL